MRRGDRSPTSSPCRCAPLADAALQRARDAGRRARRLPARAGPQRRPGGCATPASTAPSDADGPRVRRAGRARRHLGLRLRRRPDAGRGRAGGRAGRRGCAKVIAGRCPTERVELADEPVHARRAPGCRRTRSTRSRAGRREGRRCSPTGARRLLARRRRRPTSTPRCSRSRRTSSTPTPPAPSPPSSGCGCTRSSTAVARRRASRRVRHDAHARAAGRPRLGVPHRHRLGLGRRAGAACPSCWPRSCARRRVEAGRVRPGHRPVQPVADHPRVDRPRHRAGPGAGLRGRLRRHLVRHLRQARHAAVRLRRS